MADVSYTDGYPGWKPDISSDILKVFKSTFNQMYGKEPEVTAIHAGLECGIIKEKYPDMDMISFGPTMFGVHSPDEKLQISTVPEFYNQLVNVLKNIPSNKLILVKKNYRADSLINSICFFIKNQI